MPTEELTHPVQYGIFQPNPLVLADRTQLKGIEISIYNEILNHNHKKFPDEMVYEIPYKAIWPEGNSNLARDKQRIRDTLQSRSIFLDEKFMREYFDEQDEVSINPFPKVKYKKESFEVTLYPDFKKILTMIEVGFTKGDYATLKKFKHDISHRFYWLARHKQSFKRTWKISVADFREVLHITGYKDWRNFKRKVLDVCEKEMKGTWMEFTLEFIRSGKGGAVKELIFHFMNGPEEERETPIGYEFGWERELKALGIDDRMIKQFRDYVKSSHQTTSDQEVIIAWDSVYIIESIKAAAKEYKAKEKNPDRKKIKNKAAWFVAGLLNGQWLSKVLEEKRQVVNAVNGELFSDN